MGGEDHYAYLNGGGLDGNGELGLDVAFVFAMIEELNCYYLGGTLSRNQCSLTEISPQYIDRVGARHP